MNGVKGFSIKVLLLFLVTLQVNAHELITDINLQARFFNEEGFVGQKQIQTSVSLKPSYEWSWGNDKNLLKIDLFGRIDQVDQNRTHFDIRQFDYLKIYKQWELRIGIGRVFWGVTESAHLVDIINQTDFVESFDGEDKLGQPLLSLTRLTSLGTFKAFLLPYFRERTFPGLEGRLGFPAEIGASQFQNDKKEKHLDFAFRYSQSYKALDIGLSYFKGTSRDPAYLIESNYLIPFYQQISQVGLDAQLTISSLLLKLEGVFRTWEPDDYSALVFGYEYTFSSILGTSYDLGVLTEYHYDEREDLALTPFENDLFLGLRLALNDINNSQVLAGFIFDLEKSSQFLTVEASRQFGDHLVFSLENRSFLSIDKKESYGLFFEKESYTSLNLTASF